MAKVSLRVYNHEIEGMIEGGLLDESVAHCLHILKTFPMHVETYRLLGKSFLEARRYTDAADIFQRALMAVPDDFVAHVGMSIIRDDEGKLDDAIWHMERAFEDQPSNPAIQSEIRRLYGRRDGVEPPKIRLSRDALANMYSKGELFNQAIAEIRAVLVEDANRPDLQIMLARAYYRAGQKVEAAEMAANFLKKYTYCMDALRILVDVLAGNASAENTQVYRQRLRRLDPYSSFVTGSAFSTDQVPDAAVNLERLEYKAGAAPALPQPNWASSLGIKLADEKRAEPAPDWMRTVRRWQDSSGKGQEGLVDSSPEQPVEDIADAEPLAQADIPDWLKSMAPKEVTDAENAGSKPAPANPPSPGEGDAPDWLAGLETAAADANPEPSQPAASSQDNGAFPDWLKEMGDGVSAGTAAAFAADALEQPQTEEPPVSTQPAPPPKGPATQASIEPLISATHQDEDTPFQPTGESKPLKIEDEAMAWLESLAAKQGAKEEELLTKPENRSEEMPDWLSSANEQPSASAERAPEPSPAPRETLPLEPSYPPKGAGELAVNIPEPSEIVPVPLRGEELPPLASPKDAEGTDQPFNIEDDTTAWLESLATEEAAKEGELLTKPENRSEEMPDLLRSADEQPSASAERAPEPSPAPLDTLPLEPIFPPKGAGELAVNIPEPSEIVPVPLRGEELPPLASCASSAEGYAQPLNRDDDTMAWLDGLAAEEGAKPEELLTKSGEHPETPPDLMQKMTQEPAAPDEALAPETPQAAPEEDISITSWLRNQDVEEALGKGKPTPVVPGSFGGDVPQPAATPSNELPDWLKELEKPTAPEEAPHLPWQAVTGKPSEDSPDWLPEGPAPPADQGAAAVPTPELASEPEMPTWIDETIPVSEGKVKPAPTTPGEWVPVDEKPAPVPDLEPIAKPASFAVETPAQRELRDLGGAGMLARIPAQDKDAEFLAAAQAALDANQLNEAMQAYAKLIKKNRLLDEVIHDLREAIYRFPVDIIVWQTLGDASMRANRLQDALDAYTKAEELIR